MSTFPEVLELRSEGVPGRPEHGGTEGGLTGQKAGHTQPPRSARLREFLLARGPGGAGRDQGTPRREEGADASHAGRPLCGGRPLTSLHDCARHPPRWGPPTPPPQPRTPGAATLTSDGLAPSVWAGGWSWMPTGVTRPETRVHPDTRPSHNGCHRVPSLTLQTQWVPSSAAGTTESHLQPSPRQSDLEPVAPAGLTKTKPS